MVRSIRLKGAVTKRNRSHLSPTPLITIPLIIFGAGIEAGDVVEETIGKYRRQQRNGSHTAE